MTDGPPPAGWFEDPQDPTMIRWWDGSQWTDHVAPAAPPPVPREASVPPPEPVVPEEPVAQIARASGPAPAEVLADLDLPPDSARRRTIWVLAALSMMVVVILGGVAIAILRSGNNTGDAGPEATTATSPPTELPPPTTAPAITAPPTTIAQAPPTAAPTTEPPTTSVATTTTVPPPECNQIVRPLPPMRFDDIGTVSPEAQDAIRWAESVGLVSLGDRQFRPGDTMNRAEATTVLWRYFCSPDPVASAGFTDVPAAYFTDAVNWAAGEGIVSGKTANTFDPGGALSRAQFVTMAWRAVGSPTGSPPNPFTDSARGVFYTQALDWAFDVGLINGRTPTTFAPDDPLDRLTVIVLFWRLESLVDPPIR